MPVSAWRTAEEQVRGMATLIFGAECTPSQIGGTNYDGVIKKSELETIVIEITLENDLDKVRQGVTRLTLARHTLSLKGIMVRGYIVLSKTPTPAMIAAAKENHFEVLSGTQFASLFFRFPEYRKARSDSSFGSSIDPFTGKIDTIEYVEVSYIRADNKKDISANEIKDLLLDGQNIVLLGEYGSGKSRCIRELFNLLSNDAYKFFKFPLAINLRDCWGLQYSDELIRRSMYSIGMDEIAPDAVRAFNKGTLIPLLDGFDEMGSQSWSVDERRLRQLRALALKGVKDLVSKNTSGCLIAGREHYFSSDDEMLASLGLNKKSTIIIKAKEEFTDSELGNYFESAGLDVNLPSWLPKRPLICQTIALLSDDEKDKMFATAAGEVTFWSHFINVICERDARINAFFDPSTIFSVFLKLSRITRSRSANVGPISQRDMQDAFESVVGQLPVEDAAVMLQRLPSLGRIGAESSDRQFVDIFILDGLRAKDVGSLIEKDETHKQHVFAEKWINPLGPLGQSILAADISGRVDVFKNIAKRASDSKNGTLAADILGAMTHLDSEINFNGMVISEAIFSELNLNGCKITHFLISDSVFERIVMPNSPPKGVTIQKSLANTVSGAASFSGLPNWVQLDIVENFDSVQTVAGIKKAGLSPAHEILVAILKKTFRQKGGGRKEEALLRGFGASASRKTASAILNLLLREGILSWHKGDDGRVYNPELGHSARIWRLLDELRSSEDELWIAVDGFNR